MADEENPICPLDGQPMRRWLVLPGDWRRPQVSARYQLFWSNTSHFGMLHPRPSAEAVTAFYEVDNYYTHGRPKSQTNESGIAWRVLRWLAV